jgi:hypothetical protein
MKNAQTILAVTAALLFAAGCTESGHEHGDDHGHDHPHPHTHDHGDGHAHTHEKKTPGPNGGRIVETVEPHLEFLVMEDRKIQITALDANSKAVPVGGQIVTLTGGDRANPVYLAFAKQGNVLVSDKAMPEGDKLPVILNIQATPDAAPVVEKFVLDMGKCPECDLKEYACICIIDHHH